MLRPQVKFTPMLLVGADIEDVIGADIEGMTGAGVVGVNDCWLA